MKLFDTLKKNEQEKKKDNEFGKLSEKINLSVKERIKLTKK